MFNKKILPSVAILLAAASIFSGCQQVSASNAASATSAQAGNTPSVRKYKLIIRHVDGAVETRHYEIESTIHDSKIVYYTCTDHTEISLQNGLCVIYHNPGSIFADTKNVEMETYSSAEMYPED